MPSGNQVQICCCGARLLKVDKIARTIDGMGRPFWEGVEATLEEEESESRPRRVPVHVCFLTCKKSLAETSHSFLKCARQAPSLWAPVCQADYSSLCLTFGKKLLFHTQCKLALSHMNFPLLEHIREDPRTSKAANSACRT
jgi:hypothetical protein